MSKDFQVIDIDNFYPWLETHRPGNGARYTVVAKGEQVLGLARDDLLYLLRDEKPETVIDGNFFSVTGRTGWPIIMRGMRAKNSETALVFSRHDHFKAADVTGIITPRELALHAGTDAELLD
jgi:hypothetical protein